MKLSMTSVFTNEHEKVFNIADGSTHIGRVTVEKISKKMDPVIYGYIGESIYSLEPLVNKDITVRKDSYYGYNADGIHLGTFYNAHKSLGFMSYFSFTAVKIGPRVYYLYRCMKDCIHYMLYYDEYQDGSMDHVGEIVIDDTTAPSYSLYFKNPVYMELLIMLAAHSYVWEIRGGYKLHTSKKAAEHLESFFEPDFVQECL